MLVKRHVPDAVKISVRTWQEIFGQHKCQLPGNTGRIWALAQDDTIQKL